MTSNTSAALKAIFATDATITPDEIKAAMEALTRRYSVVGEVDKVVSRNEVARIMGKSVKAVDIYGRRGIIRRVYLTGGGSQRKQSNGYSLRSVNDAIMRGVGM